MWYLQYELDEVIPALITNVKEQEPVFGSVHSKPVWWPKSIEWTNPDQLSLYQVNYYSTFVIKWTTFHTHHAGILLSHPWWDIFILHPPHCACANVILPYQTKKVQLNKLPQTTMIIFRIIVGTIRFNNAKIQTHALGSMCVRRDGIKWHIDVLLSF